MLYLSLKLGLYTGRRNPRDCIFKSRGFLSSYVSASVIGWKTAGLNPVGHMINL